MIYKGIVQGLAITNAHYGYTSRHGSMEPNQIVLSFIIKINSEIPGIPMQFPVFCKKNDDYEYAFSTVIQKDDSLIIKGTISKKKIKIWEKEVILMTADNIYNVTRDFGF